MKRSAGEAFGPAVDAVVAENKVFARPSASGTVFSTNTPLLGSVQDVSKRARLPPFSGLGPGAPSLNSSAKFEPMSGTLPRPSALTPVYFQDAKDLEHEPAIDAEGAVFYNAIPIQSPEFTSKYCHGVGAYVMAHVPRLRAGLAPHMPRESLRDVMLCNVSIVNMLQLRGAGREAPDKLNLMEIDQGDDSVAGDSPLSAGAGADALGTDVSALLALWRNGGIIKAMDDVTIRRPRNMSLITMAHQGVETFQCVLYWAACTPAPQDGARGHWNWVRRPRRKELRKRYWDILEKMMRIHMDPYPSEVGRIDFFDLCKQRHAIDAELKTPNDYVWLLEPAVTLSKEEPPAFLWTGFNWRGHSFEAVIFHQHCAGLPPPSSFRDTIVDLLYPTHETLDHYLKALHTVPRCSMSLLGTPSV